MDDRYGDNEVFFRRNGFLSCIFRPFVCVALSLVLGLHVYSHFCGPNHVFLDKEFSDIKYVVMHLTRSLSEVTQRHERLQTEMERLSAALPALSAATTRAKDAIEPSLRRYPKQAGDVYDYDRQVADYALETAGGKVIDTGDTIEHIIYESPAGWMLHVLTSWMCRECLGASAMIRPGSLPGECWAFKGSRGEAIIRLLGPVRITGISMEHIAPHIAPSKEISSSPRLFQVEGLEYRYDQFPHDFGSFEYDKDGKPIQYFEIRNPSPKVYNLVRLRVLSNWGHPVYTCVYRFRVHGEMTSGPTLKYTVVDDPDLQIDNE